ncbi:MAG: hypothetical protein MMC33_007497 [Icmadophila ericetorum]|nr:hypothetical protein [Icmadophila ericetorum]
MADSVMTDADASSEDKSTLTPPHQAAKDGRTGPLQYSAEKNSDLTTRKAEGRSPLHVAADGGCAGVVKSLIAKGSAIEESDGDGRTPLHLAALKNHVQCVSLLLSKGANPNATDSLGLTPLLLVSVSNPAEEVVSLLLQHKANPNTTDKKGDTPMHFAAVQGLDGIAKLLLDAGAQRNMKNKGTVTPLMLAIYTFDLSDADSEIETGTEAVAHLLIEYGTATDFGIEGGYWGNALNAAVAARMELVVEAMVRHGAKLTQADRQGRSAIHVGAFMSEFHTQLSMVNNYQYGGQDKQGRNILHHASSHKDNFSTLNRILSANPNFNTPDFDGWMPLHWACKSGSRMMVKLLLDHAPPIGNNLSGRDWANVPPEKRVWTPLRIALFHHNDSVAALLKARTGVESVAITLSKKPKQDKLNQIRGKVHDGQICNGCNRV